MPDETMPTAASSEQPQAGPSEQGQVVAESAAPATTAVPEPKPEKQVEDPDATLRRMREQTRKEVDSEYGKKHAEAIRIERERATAERDALLTQLGQFVPDDELAKYKQTIQVKSIEDENRYWRQKAAEQAEEEKLRGYVRGLEAIVQDAGLTFKDLPPEVVGETPAGFPERFAKYTAKRLLEATKDADKREKKAREEAERETEKRLGVARVSGASPSGTGASTVEGIQKQLRDAHAKGDNAAIRRLGSELEEAVYRR
jgi:hypothetical protein